MRVLRGGAILSLVFAAALLGSCSAYLSGELSYAAPEAALTLKASLMPAMARLLRSPAISGGLERSAPVINAADLNGALELSPGIAGGGRAALRNVGADTLEGDVLIARLDEFLSIPASKGSGGGEKRFAVLEKGDRGGRLRLTLDRESSPALLALLSPDVADYLSALLAPVSTGEELREGAYLALVASVYGAAIAAEIKSAEVVADIVFPGPLTSVETSLGSAVKDGREAGRARLTLPLVGILVLEEPVVIVVEWTPWR